MKRILVATTDPVARTSTARMLVELGYRVEFGRTPDTALDRVRRQRPAAVIVDDRLASRACPAFVEACRQEVSSAEMPILVMAATPRAAIDAIRAGAQGRVKAPADRATLAPMLWQVHLPTPN